MTGRAGAGELHTSPLCGISFYSALSLTLSSSYAIQHYVAIIEMLQRTKCVYVCVRACAIGHLKLFIKILFKYEGERGN